MVWMALTLFCHMGSHKMKGTNSQIYHVARQLSDITYVIISHITVVVRDKLYMQPISSKKVNRGSGYWLVIVIVMVWYCFPYMDKKL